MKQIIILFLLFAVLLLVSCKSVDAEPNEHIMGDDVVAMGPVNFQSEHRTHTHEHNGGGCCPCGACHKKDDEHINEELSIFTRIMSCIIAATMLFGVVHEFLSIWI